VAARSIFFLFFFFFDGVATTAPVGRFKPAQATIHIKSSWLVEPLLRPGGRRFKHGPPGPAPANGVLVIDLISQTAS